MTTTEISPAAVRDRLVSVISDGMGGWAEDLADALLDSAGAPNNVAAAPVVEPRPGASGGTPLWDAVKVLAWLHAELAHKHTQLVAEINGMVQQAMGPTGMDPARVQEFRQRAVRIARIRNQNQVTQQGGQQ